MWLNKGLVILSGRALQSRRPKLKAKPRLSLLRKHLCRQYCPVPDLLSQSQRQWTAHRQSSWRTSLIRHWSSINNIPGHQSVYWAHDTPSDKDIDDTVRLWMTWKASLQPWHHVTCLTAISTRNWYQKNVIIYLTPNLTSLPNVGAVTAANRSAHSVSEVANRPNSS